MKTSYLVSYCSCHKKKTTKKRIRAQMGQSILFADLMSKEAIDTPFFLLILLEEE